jgi:hypothetical protein
VRLTLGEATVAVLSEGGEVRSVHWAGGRPFTEALEAETGPMRLTLLHIREAEDRYSVELLHEPPSPEQRLRVTPEGPAAMTETSAGRLRVELRAGAEELARGPLALHVRGAAREVLFVRDDGQALRGADLAVEGGGTVLIDHGAGTVLAWLDRRGQEAQALWSPLPLDGAAPGASGPSEVGVPALVQLQGPSQALRLSLRRQAMLHLRAAVPAITLLKRASAAPEAEVHLESCALDVYAPAGPVEIHLRALPGRLLSGTAELTATEVTPMGEGLGPEVLLPPGGTRLYSFEVRRPGPVGIGVWADSGAIECRLLDGSGRLLQGGVVQMPRLEPGTYLLALHAPGSAAPVRARPALAGLQPPDTGPPEEVIRQYLQPAGAQDDAAGEEDEADGEEADGAEEEVEP